MEVVKAFLTENGVVLGSLAALIAIVGGPVAAMRFIRKKPEQVMIVNPEALTPHAQKMGRH